jgi:hypothetical protein
MLASFFNIEGLFHSQLENWEPARTNYKALEKIKSKDFAFGDFSVRVQFNPARILSSAAKVDTKSIQERKCFLCPQNLPVEQGGIPFGTDYQILINPYPIFPQHLTIPTYSHVDQLILSRYGDMLDLAKRLDEYTLFYNGPKCGASAPDHAHFQAGIKGFLPLEKEVRKVKGGELLYQSDALSIYSIKNYLRNGFLLEAELKEDSIEYFQKIYNLLEIKDGNKEPMMNILTWYEGGKYYSCIFPREKHRPACFFAEGDDNLLISPAAVDLGGVFITPLEKDYDKITAKDIENILKEICISDEKMQAICKLMKNEEYTGNL